MANDFEPRLAQVLDRRRPQRYTEDGARDAAVLVPIVAQPVPTLLFTVRSDTLPSHKGQISFPGGSLDDGDATPLDAALREAKEEIGLDPGGVRVLGELDTFPTYVSGYVITPFVGWIPDPPALDINHDEVTRVLEVPVAELNESIRTEAGVEYAGRLLPTESWVWNGNVIWGVTGRIVREFLGVLADAGLGEPPGHTDSWSGPPPPRIEGA